MPQRQYSDEEVKEDVRSFFLDGNHWAYEYGSPTPLCNPDSPYHRKQIEVIFEYRYQHWVTDRAVKALIQEGFLRERLYQLPDFGLSFVYRYNSRYVARAIRQRAEIVRRYSDTSISRATGEQAEFWVLFLFRSNSFIVADRKTRQYQGVVWTKTGHDLDFIVEKDGVTYGVEVKNWLPYVDDDLNDIKLEICAHFGIKPLFVYRMASYLQIDKVKNQHGRILIFKSKIFPPGNERLVRDIWNTMRLPVSIWRDLPTPIIRSLLTYHGRLIST